MKKEDLLHVILSVVVFAVVSYMVLTLYDRIKGQEVKPIPVMEKVDYDTIRDVRFLT